jgi:hypothetical protein
MLIIKLIMEKENSKPTEQQTKDTEPRKESNQGREHIAAVKKPTLEERAEKENWTDVVESHLGIDE